MMMKKGEIKTMFKPTIKNKLIDVVYSDKNVKIAKYYNKKDEHGYPMNNGLTYVYTFDRYYEDWKVHAILDFDFMSNGWWYGSNCFDSYEEIAKYWAEKMFLPPRNFVSKKDKERMKIDSLVNTYNMIEVA